jgi:CDP-diacylglycerol--inositol 3-phosphatidyltransferase
MSGVRTRRQAAAVSTPSTPTPAPREQAIMNGKGSTHKSAEKESKENIFLFWPNIIGTATAQKWE